METTKMQIGARIRAFRKKLGLTQTQFGQRVGGLGKSAISAYESGDNSPSPETLAKIAEACHVTIDELVTGSKAEPQTNEHCAHYSLSQNVKQKLRAALDEILTDLPIDAGSHEITEDEIEMIKTIRQLPEDKRDYAKIMLRSLVDQFRG